MRHAAAEGIRYGRVPGLSGLETLEAKRLRLRFDRHFHDTHSFGLVLEGVERCAVGRRLNTYEPGTVPLFNPGEVHDGGPVAESWSYRMVYLDRALLSGLGLTEPAFATHARRDVNARRRVAALFDALDCGSLLGIEEALRLALESLLELGPATGGAPPRALRDVATACGYADQSHLNRWFLRVYGTTPGRYRRNFLQDDRRARL
jgi:AraC-like DNA-binding protein